MSRSVETLPLTVWFVCVCGCGSSLGCCGDLYIFRLVLSVEVRWGAVGTCTFFGWLEVWKFVGVLSGLVNFLSVEVSWGAIVL
jgi:hypothetical protein